MWNVVVRATKLGNRIVPGETPSPTKSDAVKMSNGEIFSMVNYSTAFFSSHFASEALLNSYWKMFKAGPGEFWRLLPQIGTVFVEKSTKNPRLDIALAFSSPLTLTWVKTRKTAEGGKPTVKNQSVKSQIVVINCYSGWTKNCNNNNN